MKDRTQLLIDILLDKSAREDERSDAAIDLREYKDLRALTALVTAAARPDEEDDIVGLIHLCGQFSVDCKRIVCRVLLLGHSWRYALVTNHDIRPFSSDRNSDRKGEQGHIVDDCSESIGEICVGLNMYDEKMFECLPPFSRQIIYKYIKINAPHLIVKI